MRRGTTLQATPSLRLSLAAKPNDTLILIFPTRDSVTFSTVRYGFDMNRRTAFEVATHSQAMKVASLTLNGLTAAL